MKSVFLASAARHVGWFFVSLLLFAGIAFAASIIKPAEGPEAERTALSHSVSSSWTKAARSTEPPKTAGLRTTASYSRSLLNRQLLRLAFPLPASAL
jgi:hypothetical protein